MNKKVIAIKYIFFDYVNSALAWFVFFLFRKKYIENNLNVELSQLFDNENFWYGVIFIPLFWVALFAINGFYKNVFHRSRLAELSQTVWICLLGTLVIFFFLLLDDNLADDYRQYYESLSAIFVLQFTMSYLPKLIITSSIAHKIHSRQFGFNTLMIGEGQKAKDLFSELKSAKRSAGYLFKGYLSVKSSEKAGPLSEVLQKIGETKDLKNIIQEHQIEEVIIAVEKKEANEINQLVSELQEFDVHVKMKADMHNILTGQVKMNSILHAALIEIDFDSIPSWQKFVKRSFDIIVSALVLVCFSPLYIAVASAVLFSSKGPIFFKQERIGKKGKPFFIIKFRSMYLGSENGGPQLSKENDSRITSVGKILRKTRMDEIPQFFNVLKGEMSIVGPRPERQFFIDKICERAPQYKFLYKIKPGITSWGQVKYGYAENVDEMIDRLKFDLIYLENRSLPVDIKIMIYTVLVIFQGKGK